MRSLKSIKVLDAIWEKVGDEEFKSIEFVEADLTNLDSMINACQDVDYVIHTASPVTEGSKESDFVIPAVDGVKGIMKGCEKYKVKKCIITSSMLTMIDWNSTEKTRYTSDYWVDPETTTDFYQKSKILAEKFAFDFASNQTGTKFELISILPAFIIGPPLLNSKSPSIKIFVEMLNRKYPMVPDLNMICCDVWNVAQAHVNAI